jgi:predicted nucleotidyltransferase
MKEKIIEILHNLENRYNIKILLAVNYGSRCFGYSSTESDWDVRFIYVHRPEWYFSITKTEDVIEIMMEEYNLDIEGYELKKALSLLAKTNPNISDWLHAQDYYMLDESFLKAMQSFESHCYNTRHAMYHFYSISVKSNQHYLEKEVTLKRFIHYMRGLLSCRWIELNECHPPVNVDRLIDATITDNEDVKEKAHHLLKMKRTCKSHNMEIVDVELSNYVFNLQKYYEKILPSYADTKTKTDFKAMSQFLMDTVMTAMNETVVS